MQQFIQPAADPSLPDPGKSGESGRNTNPGGVISSVRSLASFIRNPALQAFDSSVHSSTYIPSPAVHNRSLDSDALLGLRTARLRTPVAVFNTHGASGHGSYDSPLMKKALVQAIASQQGLLEISHPGVQPLLQAMQN
ncbi:MAG TPA: hypothetical protein VFV28_05580, partial [Limnobacter sp.]|nr:hypothetical protein [Limnobacter sp.]